MCENVHFRTQAVSQETCQTKPAFFRHICILPAARRLLWLRVMFLPRKSFPYPIVLPQAFSLCSSVLF